MKNILIFACIAITACSHQRKDEGIEFTLLHTNDSHGHIENFPSLKSKITELKAKHEHVLLLDGGDTLSDTLASMQDKGGTVAALMNEVGYDAMVPGNHDFDYGVKRLSELYRSGLPLIAANLVHKTGENVFPPYLTFSKGDLRIGVIGLTYPKTPFTTEKKNVENVRFSSNFKEAIEASVQKMKAEKVNVIVLLTHLGLSQDIKLAKEISGIDLIIGGHSHNRVSKPLRIRDTTIFQAGAHLQNFGRARFTFDQGKLTLEEYELVDLSALADSKQDAVLVKSNEAIPRADTIAGNFPRNRTSQSLVDSMFADLLLRNYKADGVMLPGVGYGLPLPEGNITHSDLRNLIPHDSKLYRIRLTGNEIRQIIEQSLENVLAEDFHHKIGGIIQIAGIKFTYYPEMAKGKRVSSLMIGGHPSRPLKRYEIITVGLLEEGGHFYGTMEKAKKKELLKETYPELIKRLLKEKQVISAPKDMRMIEVPILNR